MAADAEVKQWCKYCWRPASIAGHNEGCPDTVSFADCWDVDQARKLRESLMAEWERGYNHGFNVGLDGWERIEWWQYRHYSKSYLLGFRAGEAELERCIDAAVEGRW